MWDSLLLKCMSQGYHVHYQFSIRLFIHSIYFVNSKIMLKSSHCLREFLHLLQVMFVQKMSIMEQNYGGVSLPASTTPMHMMHTAV